MSKHTPGPWKWVKKQSCMDGQLLVSGEYDDLQYWAGESGKGLVLDSDPSDGEYRPAIDHDSPDARLIAAAPDLLEACETALRLLEPSPSRSEGCVWSARQVLTKGLAAAGRGTP